MRKSINHLSLHEDIFLEIYWIKLDWRCLWKELYQAKFLKHLLISVITFILFIYICGNIMWSSGHLDTYYLSYNLPSPQLKYSLYPSVHIEEFWNKVCTHYPGPLSTRRSLAWAIRIYSRGTLPNKFHTKPKGLSLSLYIYIYKSCVWD